MRRFRAPSSWLDKFFAAQFSAAYITNMSGVDLRQAQVTKTVHVGPYDKLGDAHNAIHAWCAAKNRRIAPASWEIYGD